MQDEINLKEESDYNIRYIQEQGSAFGVMKSVRHSSSGKTEREVLQHSDYSCIGTYYKNTAEDMFYKIEIVSIKLTIWAGLFRDQK